MAGRHRSSGRASGPPPVWLRTTPTDDDPPITAPAPEPEPALASAPEPASVADPALLDPLPVPEPLPVLDPLSAPDPLPVPDLPPVPELPPGYEPPPVYEPLPVYDSPPLPDPPPADDPAPAPEPPVVVTQPIPVTAGAPTAPRRTRRVVQTLVAAAGILTIIGAASYLVLRPAETAHPATVAPTPQVRTPEQELTAGFDALDLKVPVGLALVPVGAGARPILIGDHNPYEAWSTIKVPLALAAERRNGENRTETKAVIDSDNRSARILTRSLGTPEQATEAVTAVLREGGDADTVVQPAAGDDEWPHLGETTWTLTASSIWMAHLPCMPGSEHLLDLMSKVAPTQAWGLEKIPGNRTAVKGGWGLDEGDQGYLVRQIGLIWLDDGRGVAVSMSAHEPKMTFEQGTAALNTVGRWLGENLTLLPAGSCPAAQRPSDR